MEKLRHWLARKTLRLITNIDYTIQAGDYVQHTAWRRGPIKVVDINWALLSAAYVLNPEKPECVVVWSIWGASKESDGR